MVSNKLPELSFQKMDLIFCLSYLEIIPIVNVKSFWTKTVDNPEVN